MRNALIFLKRMYDMFPPTQQIADIIKEYVQSIDELYSNVTDIKTKISTYRLNDKYNQLSNLIYTPPGQ